MIPETRIRPVDFSWEFPISKLIGNESNLLPGGNLAKELGKTTNFSYIVFVGKSWNNIGHLNHSYDSYGKLPQGSYDSDTHQRIESEARTSPKTRKDRSGPYLDLLDLVNSTGWGQKDGGSCWEEKVAPHSWCSYGFIIIYR